jgi:pimeloyl-ACP methyl ester carboxylesterase
MMAHAAFLVRAGYAVLAPDCRGHGSSGGETITYGIREASDVPRWADLLMRRPAIHRLYGIGQSMGASILLESLPREPRFRALVADCPFATFEEVAYDRLRQRGLLGAVVAFPVVQMGLLYARQRYGVNLRDASPAAALRPSKVPVLLIHGARDENIPPRHSRELHAVNPATTQLWEVPGADHVASLATAPEQYQRRVIAWFEQ